MLFRWGRPVALKVALIVTDLLAGTHRCFHWHALCAEGWVGVHKDVSNSLVLGGIKIGARLNCSGIACADYVVNGFKFVIAWPV